MPTLSLGCDGISNHENLFQGNNGTPSFTHKRPKRSRRSCLYYSNSTACRQILLKSGDIAKNPGPASQLQTKTIIIPRSEEKQTTNKCANCDKLVQRSHKRLEWERCLGLVRIRCENVNSWFTKNTRSHEPRNWICSNCTLAQMAFKC